ncbi:AraC family transcriptional regulator [Sediminitomix flava]|uniref:AraC-like DNA-binding protein n=1 Tax=Sediminitomix flava TaxID=379075 RepID=A0A315Z641_SEDFL|nr:helix-turn-helix domain-containing protein [Sediminitomix flava]PWJ39182.1 AraC-like DNA-binding protein [Sediminitomix flava]
MHEEISKVQFNNQKQPIGIEIIRISDLFQKNTPLETPHRAQFFQILWIEKGETIHQVDFIDHKLNENDLLFIPFNAINKFGANGGHSYDGKIILFTDDFFCATQTHSNYLNRSLLWNSLYERLPLFIGTEVSLKNVIKSISTELALPFDEIDESILRNDLHNFMLHAERVFQKTGIKIIENSPQKEVLLSFHQLLQENFWKEKSVQFYASQLNQTEKQLHKITTNLIDKTPKQLIDECIVLHAKRMLVHDQKNVKEISYELGFEDPSYFTKYFKKHTQQSPIHFKTQLK